jgi:hypothetical protein
MPLDGLGSTCATVLPSELCACMLLKGRIVGIEMGRHLVNLEFLVIASHHGAVNRSLPFVHTARRFNRLGGSTSASTSSCSASLPI